MTASDTNRTLCSDHLKGPSIWGVMGAGSEINPTLHIVLQLSYIYILDEQSQTDLVWSSIGETAALYHSTATSTTQQSTAQRRPVIYDWQGHDHSAHQPEHRPAEATSKNGCWLPSVQWGLGVTCCKLHCIERILIWFNYWAPVVAENVTL